MLNRDGWSRCTPGTFSRFAKQLKSERFKRLRQYSLAIGGTTLLAIATTYGLIAASSVPPGRIRCERVAELIDEYKAGTLSVRMTDRVQRHLELCDHCRVSGLSPSTAWYPALISDLVIR